jgi:hypothetical protein
VSNLESIERFLGPELPEHPILVRLRESGGLGVVPGLEEEGDTVDGEGVGRVERGEGCYG